jgi:hypothetical protein
VVVIYSTAKLKCGLSYKSLFKLILQKVFIFILFHQIPGNAVSPLVEKKTSGYLKNVNV